MSRSLILSPLYPVKIQRLAARSINSASARSKGGENSFFFRVSKAVRVPLVPCSQLELATYIDSQKWRTCIPIKDQNKVYIFLIQCLHQIYYKQAG